MSQQQVARNKRGRLLFVVNFVLFSIGFISSLLTIITFFTPYLKTTFLIWLVPLQSLLIPLSFFVLGVCMTFLGLYVYNNIYTKFNPVRWFLYGYRWVSAEYEYCIENTFKMQHSQITSVTIRTTRMDVSIFENKYSWTGYGNGKQENLEVLSNGHELMVPGTKQQSFFPFNRWKFYYVYLGHEIQVGEEVVIKVKQVLCDDAGTFEPYVAKTISEPLESLKLSVLIPKELSFSNAFNYELEGLSPHQKRINKVKSPESHIQKNGNWFTQLTYEIQRPNKGHKYEIRWEW